MLHTRNGWQEILSEDGTTRSYMAIFTPEGPDDWDEVTSLFSSINEVIKHFRLTQAAHVTMSAGVLTVTFDTDNNGLLPESFIQAGKALTKRITNGS